MNNGSRSNNVTYATAKPACAACKYQRRRCAPNCLLAPYFPADKPKDFMNAQKLFGVGGLQKAVKNSMPDQREWTVKSIVFQGNARANDPVGGCLPIILKLQRDIQMAEEELRFVHHQNEMFRAQAVAAIQTHHFQVDDVLNVEDHEFNNPSLDQQQYRVLFDGIPVNTETEGSSSSSLEKKFPVLGEEGRQPLFYNQDSAALLRSNDSSRDRDVNPVHHEQEQDLEDALFPFHKK